MGHKQGRGGKGCTPLLTCLLRVQLARPRNDPEGPLAMEQQVSYMECLLSGQVTTFPHWDMHSLSSGHVLPVCYALPAALQ